LLVAGPGGARMSLREAEVGLVGVRVGPRLLAGVPREEVGERRRVVLRCVVRAAGGVGRERRCLGEGSDGAGHQRASEQEACQTPGRRERVKVRESTGVAIPAEIRATVPWPGSENDPGARTGGPARVCPTGKLFAWPAPGSKKSSVAGVRSVQGTLRIPRRGTDRALISADWRPDPGAKENS